MMRRKGLTIELKTSYPFGSRVEYAISNEEPFAAHLLTHEDHIGNRCVILRRFFMFLLIVDTYTYALSI